MSRFPTPLQLWLVAVFDLLEDARSELDPETYTAFVFVLTERLGVESARLMLGEALRATRDAA